MAKGESRLVGIFSACGKKIKSNQFLEHLQIVSEDFLEMNGGENQANLYSLKAFSSFTDSMF
jgi:hypothetical protein